MAVSPNGFYRADIDGLRAIAVLAVVVFHAFPGSLPGGFVGVDVFFVISGFLITHIISHRLQAGTFSFADFYIRRVRRIFPALSTVLMVCLVIGWFTLLPGEFDSLAQHTLAGAAFVANFAYWYDVGYFAVAAESKPLLHLWSLGIEEQFYLVWPLLLWWAVRRGWGMLKLAILVAILSFAANIATVGLAPNTAFYFPHTRLWELVAGALLALSSRGRCLPAGNGVSFAGVALLVVGVLVVRPDHFPGAWALLPVCATVLLIQGGEQAWFNKHVLSHKVLVYVGLISFPLYLWHWPLLSFLHIVWGGEQPGVALVAGAVVLAFVLSALTYHFIELPLRHGSLNKPRVGPPVAMMLFVMLMAAGVWWAKGVPARFSGGVLMSEDAIEQERLRYWADGEWSRNEDKGSPRVLVFGDSQGFDIFKSLALDETLAIRNLQSNYNCTAFYLPVKGKESDAEMCRQLYNELFVGDDLRRADILIYTFSWSKEAEPADALQHYRKAVSELRAVNPDLRIVFMGPKPLLGKHWVSVNTLVKDQKAVSNINTHLDSIKWIRYDDIEHVRALAKDLGVEFLDTAAVYCLGGCDFFVDGQFAYFDQNHFTGLGARILHDKMRASGEWDRLFKRSVDAR